jgi:CheY-like chemotaxis protein
LTLNILVIDDDDAVLKSIVRMLDAHGHEASGAVDGGQAVALALVRTPHVIILDLQMPRQNGIQVAHMIKAHSSLAAIPILALSATPEHVADESLFHQVLAKPCPSADLLFAVLAATRSRN